MAEKRWRFRVGTKVGQKTAVNASSPVLDSLYTLRQKIIADDVKRKKLTGDTSLRINRMASDGGTCPFLLVSRWANTEAVE